MDRIRLKLDAKADIRGNVWIAFSPFAVLLFVEYGINIFARLADNYQYGTTGYILFTVFYAILSILYAVFNYPIHVGISRYFISFTRGEHMHWSTIFDSVRNWKQFLNQFFAGLLISILTALGTVCFIIPGVYVAMLYSQTTYVFAENPNMKWKEAMKTSRTMMKGHTWEYFVLVISFIGWWLLVGITFGLASIYVEPYFACATARYYRSLSSVTGFNDKDFAPKEKTRTDDNPFAFDLDDDNPFSDDNNAPFSDNDSPFSDDIFD